MKVTDFLIFTIDGDTATPPTNYVAEITSIDFPSGFFSCRRVDTGQQFTFQFSTNTSGPWPGNDDEGADLSIATHDIYTGGAVDPSPQNAAIVTFDDNTRYIGAVQSVSPVVEIAFYHQPYPTICVDGDTITRSDWDAHPVGGRVTSMEGCVLDNDIAAPVGVFVNGWWSLATRQPADPGRIGGAIAPFAVVVHTTDMTPAMWNGLVHSWTTTAGLGDCAHFLLGRDAAHGLLQLAPITSNANHAGGPGHGNFVAGNQTWHPNTVSVGIEVHCTGAVRQINGDWHLIENGQISGEAVPDADVIPDPARPGRGWHIVTDYQYQQLGLLLDGLETVLGALPQGCVAQSVVEQPPAYGVFATGRRVGHVSLDAANRGDPWPQVCDWMRNRP